MLETHIPCTTALIKFYLLKLKLRMKNTEKHLLMVLLSREYLKRQ